MPFTPFHLGAGALLKAIGGRHFSFMVFGGAQVLLDIEPLVGMIRDSDVLHGYTHTLAGAAVIGAVAGAIGRPISLPVLRWLRIAHPPFSWHASFIAAWLGTFSHIALDAIMHADMSPWWPLARGNNLLDWITIDQLHLACVVMGILGAMGCAWRQYAGTRSRR